MPMSSFIAPTEMGGGDKRIPGNIWASWPGEDSGERDCVKQWEGEDRHLNLSLQPYSHTKCTPITKIINVKTGRCRKPANAGIFSLLPSSYDANCYLFSFNSIIMK